MKEFITAKEVSEEFFNGTCNYQKVLRLTSKGVLPAVKLGKSYVYRIPDLDAWAERNFSKPGWAKIR